MIPQQNCEIIASVLVFCVIKILCHFIEKYRAMYGKREPTLTSIPERNENEDNIMGRKWVPKKKHEVLKAKYKCLKKLFQIYDASVIGILPEQSPYVEETNGRKNISPHTKIDTCEEIPELSNDIVKSEPEKETVATAVIRDLKMIRGSTSLTNNKSVIAKVDKRVDTRSTDNLSDDKEYDYNQEEQQYPIPYLFENEKRRPTRFRMFVQRLFGTRSDTGRFYRNYGTESENIYAASDYNISQAYWESRRRRGPRFRRLRKAKRIHSDGALSNPIILSYVQSVQKSYLKDKTPRQCPILGCKMVFYGIINYNDHLNLCHFPDRKYICLYCHEGFGNESYKYIHENDHIGINKFGNSVPVTPCCNESTKKASITQTDLELSKYDVPEDKLKRILSLLDKIGDSDKIATEIRKYRHSETRLRSSSSKAEVTRDNSNPKSKRMSSCVNLRRETDLGRSLTYTESDATSVNIFRDGVTCHFCGEHFDRRRQLNLHIYTEHRTHCKLSKSHSSADIRSHRKPKCIDMVSEDGMIEVQSVGRTYSGIPDTASCFSMTSCKTKSEHFVSSPPSNVAKTPTESVKKPSFVNSMLQKVKSSINYRWEPGTKIIRI